MEPALARPKASRVVFPFLTRSGGRHCGVRAIPLPCCGQTVCLSRGFDAEKKLFVIQCLSAEDGSEHWSHAIPQKPYLTHRFNHVASSTPVTDGKHLVVISSEPGAHTVLAFNLEGNTLWTRRFETSISNHGGGVSPIIYDGRVILPADEDGESFLSALDAVSGEVLWRTERSNAKAGFATPCEFVDPSGTRGLLFNSMSHGISFVDPNSGKTLWEQNEIFDMRTTSSSLVVDGLVVGTCGSGTGGNYLVALNPGNAGQGLLPSLAYKLERSIPYVPTSVAKGKLLFLWGDSGILTCVKAGNGETVWRERVEGSIFRFTRVGRRPLVLYFDRRPGCGGRRFRTLRTVGSQ